MAVVLREARKEALPYRRYAVDVLGRVAEALKVDVFEAAAEMLFPLFQPPPEGEEPEEEEEERDEQRQVQLLELHEAAISTLGRTFPSNSQAQSSHLFHDALMRTNDVVFARSSILGSVLGDSSQHNGQHNTTDTVGYRELFGRGTGTDYKCRSAHPISEADEQNPYHSPGRK